MSDIVDQDRPEARWLSRFLAILILMALFVPHSLGISRLNQPDNSYIRYTVSAVLWAISHESGSTIAGPYNYTFIEFLSIPTLLLGALFLPLYIIVIITQWRFIKGTTTKKSILRVIGFTLLIQVFLQFAFLWYWLDGWASLQTYPLPIFHTLNALSVIRQREAASMVKFSLRSTASNSIISSCFWCVSIVFFTVGILVISNFFSAGLYQPTFAFSQLLIGLGFLAIAIIVIIMESRNHSLLQERSISR